VLISIADQGPGVPPAERPRIFEPFHRVSSAAGTARRGVPPAPPGVGSGLGLAIGKGFVEANGGSISVSSPRGQGTSFTIALPVSEEPAGDPAGAGAGR
jgi:signal transduction histidine kinase